MNAPSTDTRFNEMAKQLFDLLKHLTTLASGSVLLVLTISEKIFGSQIPHLLELALIAFLLSILCSLGSMLGLAFMVGPKELSRVEKRLFAFGTSAALVLFMGAFMLIVRAFLQRGI